MMHVIILGITLQSKKIDLNIMVLFLKRIYFRIRFIITWRHEKIIITHKHNINPEQMKKCIHEVKQGRKLWKYCII